MKLPHPLAVASAFRPWQHAFWLALLHDTVEDGWLPKPLLRVWPGLDAMTRREAESYLQAYIPRVGAHATAIEVKLADLDQNMRRRQRPPRPELLKRYEPAEKYLLSLRSSQA